MPGGNGKGPLGVGPMTGRGMGRCATGYGNAGFGRDRGGCGPRMGWRFSEAADETPDDASLRQRLGAMRQRIDELERQLGAMKTASGKM